MSNLVTSLCFGVYLLGWLVSIPVTLRRHMLQTVCVGCLSKTCICRGSASYRHGDSRWLPLGSVHECEGADVAWVACVSLFWPVRLVWRTVAAVLSVLGHGAFAAVRAVTPLTVPEIERRQREQAQRIKTQQDEIERLSKQLAEKEGHDVR